VYPGGLRRYRDTPRVTCLETAENKHEDEFSYGGGSETGSGETRAGNTARGELRTKEEVDNFFPAMLHLRRAILVRGALVLVTLTRSATSFYILGPLLHSRLLPVMVNLVLLQFD